MIQKLCEGINYEASEEKKVILKEPDSNEKKMYFRKNFIRKINLSQNGNQSSWDGETKNSFDSVQNRSLFFAQIVFGLEKTKTKTNTF
jgi:hypothetical protein